MKNQKKDIKFTLLIISFVILIVAIMNKYITLELPPNEYEFIRTGSIKGSLAASLVFIFILYFYKIKKSALYIITTLITLGAYITTFIATYNIYQVIPEVLNLEIGFYLYVISFLIYVSTFFLRKPVKVSENQSKEKDIYLKETNKYNENNYLLGNLSYGIKGIKYNKLSLMVNDNENNKIIIYYQKENNVDKYEISKNDIIETTYIKRVIVDEQEVKFDPEVDIETANTLLTASFFGTVPLTQNLSNKFLNNLLGNYQRKNLYIDLYQITIKLSNNKKIEYETSNSPENFINELKKTNDC